MSYGLNFNADQNYYAKRIGGESGEDLGNYELDARPTLKIVAVQSVVNSGDSMSVSLRPISSVGAQTAIGGLEGKAGAIANASVGKVDYSLVPISAVKRKVGLRDSVVDIIIVSGKIGQSKGAKEEYQRSKIVLKKKPGKKGPETKIDRKINSDSVLKKAA